MHYTFLDDCSIYTKRLKIDGVQTTSPQVPSVESVGCSGEQATSLNGLQIGVRMRECSVKGE